jgi:putative membrane protein
MIMTYGLWGLVIAALILLIRRLSHTGKVSIIEARGPSQALEILKQRYAKGEITEEEFRRMKTDLQ